MTNDAVDAPFNYGFGWFVDSYHGHLLVQHSGGTPGFSSVMLLVNYKPADWPYVTSSEVETSLSTTTAERQK